MPGEICKIIICTDELVGACASGKSLVDPLSRYKTLSRDWIQVVQNANTRLKEILEELRIKEQSPKP